MFALGNDIHHLGVGDATQPVVDDGLVQLGPDQGLGALRHGVVQLVHQVKVLNSGPKLRISDMNPHIGRAISICYNRRTGVDRFQYL